jgi:hypothetical protein
VSKQAHEHELLMLKVVLAVVQHADKDCAIFHDAQLVHNTYPVLWRASLSDDDESVAHTALSAVHSIINKA